MIKINETRKAYQKMGSTFNACTSEIEDPIKLLNPRKTGNYNSKIKDQLISKLKDKETSFRDKIISIQYLSNFNQSEVEHVLIDKLKTSTNLSESFAILGSLAEMGSKECLKDLEKINLKNKRSISKQLKFTKLLILSRSNNDLAGLLLDDIIKDLKFDENTETVPLVLKVMDKKRTNKYAENMYGSRFGIKLSNTLGFVIKSGIQNLYFLLNEESDSPSQWHKTLSKPQILGVLAKKSDLGERVYQKYIVLSCPKSDFILITAFKSNGELLLSSKLTIEKNSFFISNIDAKSSTSHNKIKMKKDNVLTLDLQYQRTQNKRESSLDTVKPN